MKTGMIFKDRNFAPLMWTQFFGALNDNVLKNSLVVLLTFKGVSLWGLKSETLVSLATLVFILPFFIFSALAGQVADKYEKSVIIRRVKLAEICIMVLATAGLVTGAYGLMFPVLFLMGVHSTFFGPVKYSALPELVSADQLTSANAYVEVGTFIAILLGTICGGYLISMPGGEVKVSAILLLISVAGYLTSRNVPALRLGEPDLRLQWNPIPPTLSTLRSAKENRAVFNSILGVSWFWFLGAVILSLLPTVTTKILNGDEHLVTVFLATFTIGIASGAVLCERLSFERVEIGLVPFGSIGMTVFLVDLAIQLNSVEFHGARTGVAEFLASQGSFRILFDLFFIAVSGGVFTVPLYTLIQQRSGSAQRSRIIGANNIMNALFMVIGSGMLMWFLQRSLTIPVIILIYAGFNLAISIHIYSIVPEFALRFLAWIIARPSYRIRVLGEKSIPAEGAAILVCNHVSFVDWLVLSAAIKRPVRFVMYYKFAGIPILRVLMKHAGVIPIAGKEEDGRIFENAFEEIAKSLSGGDLICIFPEGGISRDGKVQQFKKGIEHILARSPVPVIPMGLKGLWGSIFSYRGSKPMTRLPRRFWLPVELVIGAPVPAAEATAAVLEAEVRKMCM
jgi:1-acyl-sn-glycerol-3-phosphate acyltransferase